MSIFDECEGESVTLETDEWNAVLLAAALAANHSRELERARTAEPLGEAIYEAALQLEDPHVILESLHTE